MDVRADHAVRHADPELIRVSRLHHNRWGISDQPDREGTDDRPGLAACLKALRDGDTLVVWKLDRLGRGLHHLLNTVHGLTGRGVGLKMLTTGRGAAIDTTTPAGKL